MLPEISGVSPLVCPTMADTRSMISTPSYQQQWCPLFTDFPKASANQAEQWKCMPQVFVPSIPIACGSGLQLMNCVSLVLSHVANRSTLYLPNFQQNTPWPNCHSAEDWSIFDSSSTMQLDTLAGALQARWDSSLSTIARAKLPTCSSVGHQWGTRKIQLKNWPWQLGTTFPVCNFWTSSSMRSALPVPELPTANEAKLRYTKDEWNDKNCVCKSQLSSGH